MNAVLRGAKEIEADVIIISDEKAEDLNISSQRLGEVWGEEVAGMNAATGHLPQLVLAGTTAFRSAFVHALGYLGKPVVRGPPLCSKEQHHAPTPSLPLPQYEQRLLGVGVKLWVALRGPRTISCRGRPVSRGQGTELPPQECRPRTEGGSGFRGRGRSPQRTAPPKGGCG